MEASTPATLVSKDKNMPNLNRRLKRLLTDDSGQDLIEYALIAALIALGAILAMRGLSNKISNEFNTIGSSL
jgi:pilus assembly protein Flp/PilA